MTPYILRHTFATRAFEAGIPDAMVAALLGHTSTAMVSRVYGHVGAKSRVLQDAVNKLFPGSAKGKRRTK